MQRVYEIARELHLTNRQVIEELQRMGCAVRSYATPVDDEELEKLRAALGRRAEQGASR